MYIKIKCTYTNVLDATLWATTRACSVRLIILVKNLIIIKKKYSNTYDTKNSRYSKYIFKYFIIIVYVRFLEYYTKNISNS